MKHKPNRCHCGGLRHKHDMERIAELEFKVKLGDDFKERAHYVAKATQAAWEETVAELEARIAELEEEVQRLRALLADEQKAYVPRTI